MKYYDVPYGVMGYCPSKKKYKLFASVSDYEDYFHTFEEK